MSCSFKDVKKIKFSEIAEACGVSERTLQRWRKLPPFRAEYRRRAVEVLGDSLPLVLSTLERKAIAGHVKALELYLRVVGLLKNEFDITARPGLPKEDDRRSNEAIDAEIAELERELGLNNDDEGGDF